MKKLQSQKNRFVNLNTKRANGAICFDESCSKRDHLALTRLLVLPLSRR